MHWRFLLLVGLLTLPITQAASDAELDRATLKGLTAISVVLDRIDPELDRNGLTQAALQARLERRLQDGGINIQKDRNEFLALRILQVRGNRGPYALCLSIGLYQPVQLTRDKNIRTATQTWEVETVLMADSKQLSDASMNSVDELAARFITAYRSVNPASPQ